MPVNIAGVPALSLPCGEDSNGLPINAQLIGPHFSERLLYRAGQGAGRVGVIVWRLQMGNKAAG